MGRKPTVRRAFGPRGAPVTGGVASKSGRGMMEWSPDRVSNRKHADVLRTA